MARFGGLRHAQPSGRSGSGSRGLRARAAHREHAGMRGWPGGGEWSEGSGVAQGRGRGGLMPEMAWAWLRPSHGMGKGALWGIGKGGMGLESKPYG